MLNEEVISLCHTTWGSILLKYLPFLGCSGMVAPWQNTLEKSKQNAGWIRTYTTIVFFGSTFRICELEIPFSIYKFMFLSSASIWFTNNGFLNEMKAKPYFSYDQHFKYSKLKNLYTYSNLRFKVQSKFQFPILVNWI